MAEYRRTVKDVNLQNRYVFMRAGLDVPLDPSKPLSDPKRVTDDTRILDIMPTAEYILTHAGKLVLAAGWCGRPEGEDPQFSMAPVAKRIEQILGEKGLLKHPVLFVPNCYEDNTPRSVYRHQDEVRAMAATLKPGQLLVLENVRYDGEAMLKKREQHLEFAKFFASLVGENAVYVNEAETQNHRPEPTIMTTPLIIAQNGGDVVYGFQYANVLDNIGTIIQKLETAERGSFVFGLCGLKIESDPGITSKITVARDLIDRMRSRDVIITGGAVTYTFLLAQYFDSRIEPVADQAAAIVEKYDQMILDQTKGLNEEDKVKELTKRLQKQKSEELKSLIGITDEEIRQLVGSSYIKWGQEGEQIVFAHNVIAKAHSRGVRVITAYDHTIANGSPNKQGILPVETAIKMYSNATRIPQGWLGVAPGPKTLEKIAEIIRNAGLYIQSGPYSIEDSRVEDTSATDRTIFAAVLQCKENGGTTIAAGGDTTFRVNVCNAQEAFETVTSAGGATLELILGKSVGRDAVEEAQEFKK